MKNILAACALALVVAAARPPRASASGCISGYFNVNCCGCGNPCCPCVIPTPCPPCCLAPDAPLVCGYCNPCPTGCGDSFPNPAAFAWWYANGGCHQYGCPCNSLPYP